jgi:hypothetical protein
MQRYDLPPIMPAPVRYWIDTVGPAGLVLPLIVILTDTFPWTADPSVRVFGGFLLAGLRVDCD